MELCSINYTLWFVPPWGRGTGLLDAHTRHSLALAGVGRMRHFAVSGGKKITLKRAG